MAMKQKEMNKEVNKVPRRFGNLGLYFLLIIFMVYTLNLFLGGDPAKEITWNSFVSDYLNTKKVEKLEVINGEQVNVYLKAGETADTKTKTPALANSKAGPQYYFRIGSVETFESKLEEAQSAVTVADKIPVRYVKKTNWITDSLPWLLPVFIFIIFWMFILKRSSAATEAGKSIFNFGKSSAVQITRKKDSPTFKDVAGYKEAKAEVMEIVDFLKNPGDFTRLGAKIPKGVLIIGPPGTGKTLMAKAVAGEAGVPFFSLSGAEFVEMFVGVGASRVRDLFKTAKAAAPCIIFIDELDTVGRTREKAASFHFNDERESTLNQLLAEMDGFESDSRIVVLAATNRAEILDPALTRAGRFDRHIYLELPAKNERLEIFKVHMHNLKVDTQKVQAEFLASQTPGFSGADIANVCNEAALIAARQKKDLIESEDFIDAIEKVVAGLEKKSVIITKKEKKIIAYHESGHALVSWLLPKMHPLIKLTIIPRGKSLGSAWYLPEEKKINTKSEFEDGLTASLGGRAAEDIIFKEISSGAIDDLEKVTKTAYSMVLHMGFDPKLGNISYYNFNGLIENSMQKPFSEATAEIIDTQVRAIIETAYSKAKVLLNDNIDRLHALAKQLYEKETLDKAELEEILGKKEVPEEKILAEKFQ